MRPAKYPWRTMRVGSHFYMDKEQSAASAAAWIAGSRTKRKFKTETVSATRCRIVRIK